MKLFDFSKNEIYILFGTERVLIWYDKLNAFSESWNQRSRLYTRRTRTRGLIWFSAALIHSLWKQYFHSTTPEFSEFSVINMKQQVLRKKKEAACFDQLTCTKHALVEVSCSWFKELQRLMCKSEINWWCKQKLLRTFNHASLIQMLLFKDN